MLVDIILRLENINEELPRLFEKLQFRVKMLAKVNATQHDHYSKYYNEETKNLVAEHFVNDIQYFGYQFED